MSRDIHDTPQSFKAGNYIPMQVYTLTFDQK
jgi:hypothetical protein